MALTFALVATIYAGMVQTAGVDFWLQAKIGEIIVKDRSIPTTLLFPFGEIASERFNAHEWLASVFFYLALDIFGESGLPFVTCLLGLSYFSLCALLAYRRSNGNLAFALTGGAVALAAENYRHVLRPELVTFNVMALYWLSLESFRNKPSLRRACLPLACTIVWVNCHGSFILAPILAGIYAAGAYADHARAERKWLPSPSSEIKALAILALGVSLACLVNPFGWDMVRFVFDFSSAAGFSAVIYEWMPSIYFITSAGFQIGVAVWLTTLVLLLKNWRNASLVDWLVFVAFSLLAYKAIRFPVYLGIVFAFVFPRCFGARAKDALIQIRVYKGLLACIVGVFGVVVTYGNAYGVQPYSLGVHKLSEAMVKQLEDPAMQGNVLTSMSMGAELIYRAYPRLRPSVDCRVDSYGLDYISFQDALFLDNKLLDEYVQRYDVKYILIDRERFLLFVKLEAWKSKQWEVMILDGTAALLRRADLAN